MNKLGPAIFLAVVAGLVALAVVGMTKASHSFSDAYATWRNPPTAVVEAAGTTVYSDGVVSSYVPSQNEVEIEVPAVLVTATLVCETTEAR